MAKIEYTHNWSLLVMLLGLLLFFLCFGLMFSLFHSIFDYDSDWIDIIPFILTGIIFFYFYFKIAPVISTYLYVRFSLSTKISYKDADSLVGLFLPNESGKWTPMKDVKKLPIEKRRDYLLELAKLRILERYLSGIISDNNPD